MKEAVLTGSAMFVTDLLVAVLKLTFFTHRNPCVVRTSSSLRLRLLRLYPLHPVLEAVSLPRDVDFRTCSFFFPYSPLPAYALRSVFFVSLCHSFLLVLPPLLLNALCCLLSGLNASLILCNTQLRSAFVFLSLRLHSAYSGRCTYLLSGRVLRANGKVVSPI